MFASSTLDASSVGVPDSVDNDLSLDRRAFVMDSVRKWQRRPGGPAPMGRISKAYTCPSLHDSYSMHDIISLPSHNFDDMRHNSQVAERLRCCNLAVKTVVRAAFRDGGH